MTKRPETPKLARRGPDQLFWKSREFSENDRCNLFDRAGIVRMSPPRLHGSPRGNPGLITESGCWRKQRSFSLPGRRRGPWRIEPARNELLLAAARPTGKARIFAGPLHYLFPDLAGSPRVRLWRTIRPRTAARGLRRDAFLGERTPNKTRLAACLAFNRPRIPRRPEGFVSVKGQR